MEIVVNVTLSYQDIAYSTTRTVENSSKTRVDECGVSVHDIERDKSVRLLILYITLIAGVVGAVLVVLWMVCSKKTSTRFNQFSRVNAFILNLTIADLCVILLAVLPQVVWEYVDREWTAGPVMCRLLKFVQSFSMMSSNYMLVVIAIDRHQAIRSPLKESLSIWKMAGSAWIMAVVLSLPLLGIFHTNVVDGKQVCENIFRHRPTWHRQLWLTFVGLIVFCIPLIVMTVCYLRIFLKISQKARQNSRADNDRGHNAVIPLQSTHSNCLPKAKIKTLKMTFVIIMVFVVCTSPYFIVEMILSYGDHCVISKTLYGLLGGMAACNSATNPFVFLAFNVKMNTIKDILCLNKKQTCPVKMNMFNATTTSTAHTHTHYSVHSRNGKMACQPFIRQDTRETSLELRDV